MAVIAKEDFRTATLAEHCQGIALDTTEAPDALLTAAIVRQSQRFDDLTMDHYEPENLTLTTQATEVSRFLILPKRCTAVSQLRIANSAGTFTVQTSGVYRLRSSLYASGSKRLGGNAEMDWLELVPWGGGLSGLPMSSYLTYAWPTDTNSIEITGTFGWTTCPGDVKRAVALLCYDQFKSMRGDLQRATSIETGTQRVDFAGSSPTGIPEVDSVIADYRRENADVLVG